MTMLAVLPGRDNGSSFHPTEHHPCKRVQPIAAIQQQKRVGFCNKLEDVVDVEKIVNEDERRAYWYSKEEFLSICKSCAVTLQQLIRHKGDACKLDPQVHCLRGLENQTSREKLAAKKEERKKLVQEVLAEQANQRSQGRSNPKQLRHCLHAASKNSRKEAMKLALEDALAAEEIYFAENISKGNVVQNQQREKVPSNRTEPQNKYRTRRKVDRANVPDKTKGKHSEIPRKLRDMVRGQNATNNIIVENDACSEESHMVGWIEFDGFEAENLNPLPADSSSVSPAMDHDGEGHPIETLESDSKSPTSLDTDLRSDRPVANGETDVSGLKRRERGLRRNSSLKRSLSFRKRFGKGKASYLSLDGCSDVEWK